MKRLEVEPRTPDWHAIRSECWTASAAAILVCKDNAILLRDYAATKGVTLDIEPLLQVGIESYFGNTLWTAWAEKMGRIPRFNGNAHTERGTANEELVIRAFEADQLMMVAREVTALSSLHPGLLASFDALAPSSSDPSVSAPHGFPVEAKCPAFGSRKKLWEAKKAAEPDIATRKAQWEARGGVWGAIMGLPYYWCQVQQQILVSEAPYGWFTAAGVEPEKDPATGKVIPNPDGTEKQKVVFPITEKVPRDDAFLAAYVAAANFYKTEFLDGFIEPPKLPSDEALLAELEARAEFERAMHDKDHAAAVELYLDALREEREASKRREELEARLVKAAAEMRAEGTDMVTLADRLEVVYSTSKGSVSWQRVTKEILKRTGMAEVPPDILTACEGKPKESVKLREVV